MRLPLGQKWTQTNESDLFGAISASRGINLDEQGYVRLSSRTFSLISEDMDAHFDLPVSIGRYDAGSFVVVTEDDPFVVSLSTIALSALRDTDNDGGISAPTLSAQSWGTFWQNRWYATQNALLVYKTISNGNWDTTSYALTAGKTHAIEVFRNRQTLCITNGNGVKQINTAHSESTLAQLVLESDYEAVGLAYSNKKMGVITRLASTISGQGSDAYFFVWDGTTAAASQGEPVGSDACVGIVGYRGTWVILTRTGQLRMWNGGGFTDLGAFPFYYKGQIWGDFTNKVGKGVNMWVEGDVIYINVQLQISNSGRHDEMYLPYSPSGLWCYDPSVGLYNRYQPSQSTLKLLDATSAHVDTATDIITTAGTVPATGGIARYIYPTSSGIGGLTLNQDYYVIKLSATTFRLATTYQNAIDGVYIDLTTTGGASNFFLAFDIVDYGVSLVTDAGGIALAGMSNIIYDHMLFGAQVPDYNSGSRLNQLVITVPEIEARGYIVTGKMFPDSKEDMHQSLVVRYKTLANNDAIIVKSKTKDLVGLPVTTFQNGKGAFWTSNKEFYSTADLSDVLTAFNNGDEIECEVLSGAGAGVLSKVTEMAYSGGNYSFVLEDEVIGAGAGLYLHAQFDNYKTHAIINADTQGAGYTVVPVGIPSKWIKYKLELRGVNTTIENIDPINAKQQ